MLCKKCGRELPYAGGKFCPFCGAPVEQTGVSDETEVFTTLPEELRNAGGAPADSGIDLSAFDAARRQSRQALEDAEETMAIDPLADTSEQPAAAPRVPQQRPEARPRPTQDAPRTTYYGGRPDPDDRVYRKPSKGRRAAIVTLVVLLVAALIGGGVWFFMNHHKNDENLTLAEKYMDRGDFDKALSYYEKAAEEAKDPTAINAAMQLIRDYQNAEDYVDNEQYTEAIAALKQLRDRVTDKDSTMYKSIEDLLSKAQSAQSDSAFASDLEEAQGYLEDDKLDAASGKLDSLEQDSSLTDEQRKQVEDMKNKLQSAKDSAQQQQENEQKKSERRQEFSSEMDELESDDLKISSAANAEDELAMTASSFEQWDELLSEMYDYLAGVLNADQYASEEENYKQWVAERDSGAENAAGATEDSTQKQLASYSFKQSYTKARCYKLLDMM